MKKMSKIKQITIPIRKGVLAFIDEKFDGNSSLVIKENTLKKELVIYLIHYILVKTGFEGDGLFLNSRLLRKNFLQNYKPYLSFLEDIDFLSHLKEYSAGNHSNLYQLTSEFYSLDKEYTTFKITDINLSKKINYDQIGLTEKQAIRNKYCKEVRNHLVKSFNTNLEMDITGATKEIICFDKTKYDANMRTVYQYANKQWSYSIKKETDNRLHTILTRTNNKLLKFITYKKEKLGEIDIKTSQPLFLYIILKTIFNGSMDNEIGRFLKKKLGSALIEKIKIKGIDFEELENFRNILLNKDLYIYLGENVKTKKLSDNRYYYLDKNQSPFKNIYFDSKRDLIKNVVMRSLYKGKGDEVTEVKQLFKSIFGIADVINKHDNLSKSNNNLSNVLQNIEAHIVLDLIAKDISKKFKNIPLFSKHDSLITYKSSIIEVRDYAQIQFLYYTGIDNKNILKIKEDNFL
jgi:hypothetical protein